MYSQFMMHGQKNIKWRVRFALAPSYDAGVVSSFKKTLKTKYKVNFIVNQVLSGAALREVI